MFLIKWRRYHEKQIVKIFKLKIQRKSKFKILFSTYKSKDQVIPAIFLKFLGVTPVLDFSFSVLLINMSGEFTGAFICIAFIKDPVIITIQRYDT